MYQPAELWMYHVELGPAIFWDPVHADFVNCYPPPPSGGGTSNHSFGSTIYGRVTQAGQPDAFITPAGMVTVSITYTNTAPDGTEQYGTEMTGLDLSGGGGGAVPPASNSAPGKQMKSS